MGMRTDRRGLPPRGSAATAAAGRAGMLGIALTGSSALLSLGCARHGGDLLARVGDSAPEHGVALGLELTAVGAATLLAGWLALLFLAGAVEALAGCPLARALTPVRALTRRLAPELGPRFAAGLVGSVVVLTSAGAAHAHEVSPPVPASTPTPLRSESQPQGTVGTTPSPGVPRPAQPEDHPAQPEDHPAPDPGWRPTTSPSPPPRDSSVIELVSRGSAEPDTVVVRTGDTLWDIAARQLGPEADAAAIATEWPRWHEANREAIGADPDLLLPGMVLVPPHAEDATTGIAS